MTTMDKDPDIHVIRLWKLPSNFYSLSLEQQWVAVAKVTEKATALKERRKACPMEFMDEALIIGYFLVTLGLPWVVGAAAIVSFWSGSWLASGSAVGTAVALSMHPMVRFSNKYRSSRLALALIKYFTMEILKNVNDPLMAAVGTSAVDDPAYQKQHLPAIYLACPHGVFNYGAIAWCCVSRWMSGWCQYTGAAGVMTSVPGLRYLDLLIWVVDASRKNIKASLQVPEWLLEDIKNLPETTTTTAASSKESKAPAAKAAAGASAGERRRVGGMIGMVPDGILGAFRSKAEVDELVIGKKRGLLRIGMEEGATLYTTWFFGTTEMLTVVQDPFGLMETASRKLKAGFLGYYGRWGLPVPRRVPCTVVVAPHVCGEKTASPTAEELEVLHTAVYGKLTKVYNEQKAYAGYPNKTLIVK